MQRDYVGFTEQLVQVHHFRARNDPFRVASVIGDDGHS